MSSVSGILTINLAAIRENYRFLKQKVGPSCVVSAVVKANAYGLGAETVAKTLLEEGARVFFVASIEEAVALRSVSEDIEIYVLNGFIEDQAQMYLDYNLIPVLDDFNEIRGLGALAKAQGRALPAALHFNTRMNRLGIGSVEAKELFAHMEMLDGLELKYIMSHLACADEPDHEMNARQLAEFQAISSHFPDVPKSFANSSGIFLGEAYHFDMVRPGMALYGLNPVPHTDNPMRSVVSLDIPILRRRRVYAGASVGYGASYHFEKETELATISAGYADGLFWSLQNSGSLYWRGYECPIRGRVSMDLTTVDLSAVPADQYPKPGDKMEVLGPHQSADQLGKAAGTIGYEVLTRLGRRYERHYED